MKRIIALLLAVACLIPLCAGAEQSTEDYSWLDDLSINQLRALAAEIQKRLPANDAADNGGADSIENPLLLLWGQGDAEEPAEVESLPLSVGEKITTDSATFEVLEIGFLTRKMGVSSGWVKVSSHGVSGDFHVDSDCSLLTIFYRVKNISTKSKWFWPSNLKAVVHWNEYEFELLGARPFGDLQSTQEKTYVAVAEIPNSILYQGCNDIVIDLGFGETFSSINGLEYADHRFTMHTRY